MSAVKKVLNRGWSDSAWRMPAYVFGVAVAAAAWDTAQRRRLQKRQGEALLGSGPWTLARPTRAAWGGFRGRSCARIDRSNGNTAASLYCDTATGWSLHNREHDAVCRPRRGTMCAHLKQLEAAESYKSPEGICCILAEEHL